MVSLDLAQILTGNNPQETVTSYTITNNVIATTQAICSQPHDPGCYAGSVCIAATINVIGVGNFNTQFCGSVYASRTLVD